MSIDLNDVENWLNLTNLKLTNASKRRVFMHNDFQDDCL